MGQQDIDVTARLRSWLKCVQQSVTTRVVTVIGDMKMVVNKQITLEQQI